MRGYRDTRIITSVRPNSGSSWFNWDLAFKTIRSLYLPNMGAGEGGLLLTLKKIEKEECSENIGFPGFTLTSLNFILKKTN